MKKTVVTKIFALLFALCLFGTVLTACGGDPTESTGETTAAPDDTEETTAAGTAGGEETVPAEKMDFSEMDLSEYVSLGQYKNVPVTVKEMDYLVDLRTFLLEDGAYFEKITEGDRVVEEGDIINVDYTGFRNGIQFDGGKASNQDITVYEGTGYIEGFASGFLGAKIGEKSSFNVTFPENYGETSLAGKEVTFEFTVNHIYEFDEITDEMANDLSTGAYPTAEAYEEYRRSLLVQADLWVKIVNNATVISYPKQQVEYYYRQNRSYYEYYATYNGMEYEAFLAYFGLTDRDLYESAELYVQEDLVYHAIRDAENISLTDEEYEAEIGSYIRRYKEEFGYTDAEIEANLSAIEDNMLYDKVQRLLISWADVTWE